MTRRSFLALLPVLPLLAQGEGVDAKVASLANRILETDKQESKHLKAIVRAYKNLAPSQQRSAALVTELSGALACATRHCDLLRDWRTLESGRT